MSLLINNCRAFIKGDFCDVNILVENGNIIRISKNKIEEKTDKCIDIKYKYLFPGFIDAHTHLFKHGSQFGVNPERLLSSGVTTAIDMGSAGYINYPSFHKSDIKDKIIDIKTFINYSPVGQLGSGFYEPLDDKYINENDLKEMCFKYSDEIIGIKIRYGKELVSENNLGPLLRAVSIAEDLKLPICIHTTNSAVDLDEICKLLRNGDILSHVYQLSENSILEDGKVKQSLKDTKKRGIFLEVGNGRKNFSFEIAERAFKENLYPDIISSDATYKTYHRDNVMWDLPFVTSKLISMGMEFNEAIKAITETPAKIINDRIGFIREGYKADMVVCDIDKNETEFIDFSKRTLKGNFLIKPILTIKKGIIVFNEANI